MFYFFTLNAWNTPPFGMPLIVDVSSLPALDCHCVLEFRDSMLILRISFSSSLRWTRNFSRGMDLNVTELNTTLSSSAIRILLVIWLVMCTLLLWLTLLLCYNYCYYYVPSVLNYTLLIIFFVFYCYFLRENWMILNNNANSNKFATIFKKVYSQERHIEII